VGRMTRVIKVEKARARRVLINMVLAASPSKSKLLPEFQLTP